MRKGLELVGRNQQRRRNRKKKKKNGEDREKKRKNTNKLSPNLFKFESYGSCNLFPLVLETLEPKMKKKTLRKLT
jgi:hypothetical protein